MSIENLKKILESERNNSNGLHPLTELHFKYGHEAATNRLLPLLQKAVEMAELISCKSIYVGENGWKDEHFLNVKQAEEFLAEFTKRTEIKKEGDNV